MGANTYIGNAPNLHGQGHCRRPGVKMPSFFGYMLWSWGHPGAAVYRHDLHLVPLTPHRERKRIHEQTPHPGHTRALDLSPSLTSWTVCASISTESNPDDVIWTPGRTAQRLADKDGVLTTGSQRIDAALLAARAASENLPPTWPWATTTLMWTP